MTTDYKITNPRLVAFRPPDSVETQLMNAMMLHWKFHAFPDVPILDLSGKIWHVEAPPMDEPKHPNTGWMRVKP